jgi:hypothetical protein
MKMHKIWNILAYIYVMMQYVTSWSIGLMFKDLVCGLKDKGSIPPNDILSLVLNDYNMTTWCHKWL